MSNSNEKVEAIFEAAVALETETQRADYLRRVCPDSELRREVESLLEAHQQPDDVFEEKTKRVEAPFSEGPGTSIGRYKLLERVGEGGCGVVYVAEQTEPVRRRVALKVIKLGMDTKQVVARFEAERQALAMMDHPNIAKVLDAGTTETGRPYFVMELVRGIKITDYCDQNNLSTRERLDLFIKVCHAIQHAHQKGVIHRDIKPSNILVTLHDGVPVPKVIDFGIAKATEGRLTDATVYTQLHQFIGTPAYMSPEQAEMSGLDIDTRSDIYSLGVLLYELLTGKTSFDAEELMKAGVDQMRKTIREQEPMRPSTRLATLQGEELTTTAKHRSSEPPKLINLLRGDLDWIVMKCLEKDRMRRYETASGLAADIKRHLADEPVVARPPSAVYRFQKAWRRNKVVYTAGSAVALALVVGLFALGFALAGQKRLREAERATTEAREKAALQEARANSTAAVVVGMLTNAIPRLLEQENRTGIRAVINAADQMVSLHLKDSPLAEFAVRRALVEQLTGGGVAELAGASEQIKRMEQLLPKLGEEQLPALERKKFQIVASSLHAWTDDPAGGAKKLQSIRQSLKTIVPAPTDLIASTLISEGAADFFEGQYATSESLLREAADLRPGVINAGIYFGSPSSWLAVVLLLQGKYSESLTQARDALDLRSAEDHAGIVNDSGYVLMALCGVGHPEEAERFLETQLRTAESWDERERLDLQYLRGLVKLSAGRWEEASDHLVKIGQKDAAGVIEWTSGALAAAAAGDTNAYSKLVNKGLQRFYATSDTLSALWLWSVITEQAQPPEVEAVAEAISQRLQKTTPGWWTALTMVGEARRNVDRGRYQAALNDLDRWLGLRDLHGKAASLYRAVKGNGFHHFIRAVALAELGDKEAAHQEFLLGWTRTKSGPPRGVDCHMVIDQYLITRVWQRKAVAVLTAKGIILPQEAIVP